MNEDALDKRKGGHGSHTEQKEVVGRGHPAWTDCGTYRRTDKSALVLTIICGGGAGGERECNNQREGSVKLQRAPHQIKISISIQSTGPASGLIQYYGKSQGLSLPEGLNPVQSGGIIEPKMKNLILSMFQTCMTFFHP